MAVGYLHLLHGSWLPRMKKWKIRPYRGCTCNWHSFTSLLCQSQLVKIVIGPSSIQGDKEGLHCLMEEWQFYIVGKYVGQEIFSQPFLESKICHICTEEFAVVLTASLEAWWNIVSIFYVYIYAAFESVVARLIHKRLGLIHTTLLA